MSRTFTLTPGEPIIIIGGTYKGSTGHVVKVHKVMCTVALNDVTSTSIRRVNLDNVAPTKTRTQTTLCEALAIQPSISAKIEELCTILATAGITADNPQILPMIHLRLTATVTTHNACLTPFPIISSVSASSRFSLIQLPPNE
jgi:ribosomal protein L24